MSNAKKTAKPNPSPEELQAQVAAALQKLIAQGKKDGMIRAADLKKRKLSMTASICVRQRSSGATVSSMNDLSVKTLVLVLS